MLWKKQKEAERLNYLAAQRAKAVKIRDGKLG